MKLSRTAAYAVQATLRIARDTSNRPVPSRTLASEGRLPQRFLPQILRDLVNHGILHSTRGVDGGYNLKRRPDEISLLQIIEAMEGPLEATASEADDVMLGMDRRVRDALASIASTARAQLAAIKLSDLMSSPPPAEPAD